MKYIYGLVIRLYNCIIATRIINNPNPMIRRIRAAIYHNICFEQRVCLGSKNKEKVFYVIRCPQDEMGLFAIINFVVYHLKIADKNGYDPVVDWQHYPNKYFSENDKVGKENAWDYFFEPITNVSLKDVYKSHNVIMSSGDWDAGAIGEINNINALHESHRIFNKYIRLNEEMRNRVNIEAERVGVNTRRILGLKIRGTDFVVTKPKDHSKVLDFESTIEVVKRKEEEWGYFDRIYLSTEDEEVLNDSQKEFGERLYYTETRTYHKNEINSNWLGEVIDKMETDKIEPLKGYLISTYILSMTDYLIAPAVGGTVGAMRIKGDFKGVCII